MLTFAYIVGGWVYEDAYVIKRIKQSYYYCIIKWIHKHLMKSQVHKIHKRLSKEQFGTNVKIYLFTNQCHC